MIKENNMPADTMTPEDKVGKQSLSAEKQSLAYDIAKSEERQQQLLRDLGDRKKMPGGLKVYMPHSDPLTNLQRRLCPESLTPWEREGRAPTDAEREESKKEFRAGCKYRFKTADVADHRINLGDGWVPVREMDGSHAMFGRDYCYYRDIRLSRVDVRNAAKESRERAVEKDRKMREAEAEGGGEITEDETIVTQKSGRA